MTLFSRSEEETIRIGMSLAAELRPGDIVLLRGDLGAGKSVLARGVARGLGVTGPVPSPTFTLLNCHEGRAPLHHFDLYRMDDPEEFYAAGLEDALSADAISLVEWPERCEEAMPPCRLEIAIVPGADEAERVLTLTPLGGFREIAL